MTEGTWFYALFLAILDWFLTLLFGDVTGGALGFLLGL